MAICNSKPVTVSIALALALAATLSAYSVTFWKRRWMDANTKIKKLEISLKSALDNCAAERQGRVRAQQALRKALTEPNSEKVDWHSYPMAPIATIKSCFSTRNGTPRQPLLVPLARAYLQFDPTRAPQASLEGLEGYSHCWIIYVFHLNTDLDKLWKHPSKSKFKSKVRVPSLKGRTMGVFATRSPHRPCPIGLTVAKIKGIEGQRLVLSGVDLVNGTPVLDVKPYLPYCDSINEATVPDWVKADNSLAIASVEFSEGFSTSLTDCWVQARKGSLYSTVDEFKVLIKQVLSWDIRSLSQRNQPHQAIIYKGNTVSVNGGEPRGNEDIEVSGNGDEGSDPSSEEDVIYCVILENVDVLYRVNGNGCVLVDRVALSY